MIRSLLFKLPDQFFRSIEDQLEFVLPDARMFDPPISLVTHTSASAIGLKGSTVDVKVYVQVIAPAPAIAAIVCLIDVWSIQPSEPVIS